MESQQIKLKASPEIDALANQMRPQAYLEMRTGQTLLDEAYKKERVCFGKGSPELEERAGFAALGLSSEFDPKESVKTIRELAKGAVQGDEKATKGLIDEMANLNKTPNLQAIVLDQLARPDASRRLPVATVDIDPNTKEVASVTFEPGCLDGNSKSRNMTYHTRF